MLGKLAYRNTKRNIKDYLIYLITVTASFSLIFAFNLVANSDEIVKLCSSMDAFKNSLFAVNILIIFVICFLINYTTKFMFEKRSKELGTYMLLGIKKKEIAHLVVIENILLGILAFVLAIPIGFLFSQFVSLVIVNLLGIPKTLFISLNFVSIGLLIIYFLTIYVLVLLNLLRRISKMTIRDFLYFDKQNEKKMFRDSKKRNVIFVLSIILGAISLFLWNSRCTMDNFNKQETLTYLMVSVIMLIISIYGISTTCADMFLTVILKFCIIPSLTVAEIKNRCIPCVYWGTAIFVVVMKYSNLFFSFAFFLDRSHFAFGYELIISSEAAGFMKIICNGFTLI